MITKRAMSLVFVPINWYINKFYIFLIPISEF